MTTQTELLRAALNIVMGYPDIRSYLGRDICEVADEALTQPEQPAPHGWRLVPVEPTPEMLRDGWKVHPSAWGDEILPPVWAAMLAASPAPPQAEQAEAAKPETLSEFIRSDDSTRATIGARVVDAAVEMQREVAVKPETERAECGTPVRYGSRHSRCGENVQATPRATGCPDTMDDTARFAADELPAILRKQAG